MIWLHQLEQLGMKMYFKNQYFEAYGNFQHACSMYFKKFVVGAMKVIQGS